ncbi:MAG: hypothetical protein A4E44_00709 [Methanosaeta sp. PtaB.Bin018]|jgi:hypothetical protein|nr:MAG: hypothetical protein A4E44_00709 [Methanosaeta sp. PtaB.Bin018]OPY47223.1 MAG: hypothetical protein A4E46_00567 [Methanosaeta sp. PtaU1.Bin016]
MSLCIELLSFPEERRISRKQKADARYSVIGICEGPPGLAEKHDS